MSKTTSTPKAVIHLKFGNKAQYKVEEVQEPPQNGCPGLAIQQKAPCLYRCKLQLPDFSVVSGTFKKKKDAEQDAADLALKKLGLDSSTNTLTVEKAQEELVTRIEYLFSETFPGSEHPLSGHFKAALRREGELCGQVPASVIAAYDAKLNSLCKCIDPRVESNPFLVISFIMQAAASLIGSLVISKEQLWIKREITYPAEITESSLMQHSCSTDCVYALFLPTSLDNTVKPVILNVSSSGYYLDMIAQKLGLTEASEVLVSRPIGKVSSETRLYFAASQLSLMDASSELNGNGYSNCQSFMNARASYLSGHSIYGDAILASIGYRWKSIELFHEDINLKSYYRMLLNKTPSGVYKLSREAILMAELPTAFTTKSNWRGLYPKEILSTLCRQHRLSEPVINTPSSSLNASSSCGPQKKLKVTESSEETGCVDSGVTLNRNNDMVEPVDVFKCEVKVFSKIQELLFCCSPGDYYKKQNDSIQNASLKVLSWLNAYFKELDMPLEKLKPRADALGIEFDYECFLKEFALCPSMYHGHHGQLGAKSAWNILYGGEEDKDCNVKIEGSDSSTYPSNGSLACISYSASLVTRSSNTKELLESVEEFEFEMGVGAVVPFVESVVSQMSVGQSAFLLVDLPSEELVASAAKDFVTAISLMNSDKCSLEYCLTLLNITAPMEDRMEQALFSPPLSKQRVEYALQHIRESDAASLIDFGCGSGSLLDSLMDYPTTLEKIVGVDISIKSLARAAKVLHPKLSKNLNGNDERTGVKSAILYDGSITDFDSRLCGFDIATCLEVIEHMEEDQACLFGEVVLNLFCPRILIVSTPNFEYNVILQRSNLINQEGDADEKQQLQSCKFRNHDHKFEWTREQFQSWASNLARKHNYSVEFSGVGGSANIEPGFASQIAVFRRNEDHKDDEGKVRESINHCKVIWEWNRGEILNYSI